MAETKVIMPQMGESIFEGTITQWLKSEGDRIERDEPLFEISTDKIDSEIPAPQAGILKQIIVREGETVEINTVVAIIASDDSQKTDSSPAADEVPAVTEQPRPETAESSRQPKSEPDTSPTRIHSSPLVRSLAAEHGIDLEVLRDKGTGAGGRITKRDILSHLEQQRSGYPEAPPTRLSTDTDVRRIPMTPMRKAIADHMVSSKRTSPHVATFFEVDCSAILAARNALQPEMTKAGTRLTISPFFIQAAARSLQKFPVLNSSVEGDEIVMRKSIHIGLAVALDDGLLVPVIRNADKQDVKALALAVNDLAERARRKKLAPDEVQGGTFTITNPGNFGGLFGIPIINQPQVAILAIGGIDKRPVVIHDAIAIRPMVYLALSFDHRVIDGAIADQFMAEIKRTLENWDH